MFTGIITELGSIRTIRQVDRARRITVQASATSVGLALGDSVAVNGVCLTVIERDDECFTVHAVEETLERTTLGILTEGSLVNLERPMPADGRFDGHVVQGHVDGVGIIQSIAEEGEAARLRIDISQDLARYVVEKGSITVDGTSLTITAVSPRGVSESWFEIVLIPHTRRSTVFSKARAGTTVNLEVDVIAKYVERMMGLGE